MTTGTALRYLQVKGVEIHPASYRLESINNVMGSLFRGGMLRLRIGKLLGLYDLVKRNSRALRTAVEWEKYGGVVADEFWELLLARPDIPGAFITDFSRFGTQQGSLSQRLVVPYVNMRLRAALEAFDSRIYVGLAPRVGEEFEFYGQLFTHTDRFEVADEGFVLVNLGGTLAGRKLLEEAMPVLDEMDLAFRVIGPSEHFVADALGLVASAKVVLSLAGYGSLIEISRFGRRAIITPLGGDFEQAMNARIFSGRAGYRVLPLDRVNGRSLRRLLTEVLVEKPDPPSFSNAANRISHRLEALFHDST